MNSMNKTYENSNNQQRIPSIYQPPTITTYSSSELLDLIGPVQAYGGDILDHDNAMGYYAPEEESWRVG